MSDNPRIDELKRRVQQDPASIAFAALADQDRRAGLFHDAVETCRAGLQRHPAYVSARVTLGRSAGRAGGVPGSHQASRAGSSQRPGKPGGHPCPRGSSPPERGTTRVDNPGCGSRRVCLANSTAPTVAPAAPAAETAPVIPTVAVAQQAPAVPPIPVTQAVPVAPPASSAPAPPKPLTVSADSHQSIALVTLAGEPDAEDPRSPIWPRRWLTRNCR